MQRKGEHAAGPRSRAPARSRACCTGGGVTLLQAPREPGAQEGREHHVLMIRVVGVPCDR